MKMKTEHYDYIKHEIDNLFKRYNKENLINEYSKGLFPKSDRVKDLQERFCFDLVFRAGLSKYFCENLYSYLNDKHIYTALKKICPKVSKQY